MEHTRNSRVMRRFGATLAAVVVAASTVSGCGVRIPSDPEGTLDRISEGELRVGASAHGTLVSVDGNDVSGSLPELIEGFADEHGASITWTVDSEERLVDLLEDGDLDLAIGGMTDASPWADRVSLTRGYKGIPGAADSAVVVAMPLGENGLQSALEEYLDREVAP